MIAVGAALLLIYYSRNPGVGSSFVARAKKVQATIVPEKRYKRSEDGKVVYLFDDDDEDKGTPAGNESDSVRGKSDQEPTPGDKGEGGKE
jgi:hypothetical protein